MQGTQNADSDAEDTKYNRDEYLEMMSKRAMVKEKKMEAERKAAEEAERLAKLNDKRRWGARNEEDIVLAGK